VDIDEFERYRKSDEEARAMIRHSGGCRKLTPHV
jgi:cation diffusion facilitator family transporter